MRCICDCRYVSLLALHCLILHIFDLAIVFYEYAITLDQEIEQIWNRKLSWTSALFFINRYCLVIGQIVLLLVQFGWPGLMTKASSGFEGTG